MDFIVPQIYWGDGGELPNFSDLYTDWQAAADAAGRALVPASSNNMRLATIGGGRTRQEEVESHALIARAGSAAGHNLWHSNSTDYPSWSGPGGPYELTAAVPSFPWRSTEGVIVGRVYEADGVTPVTDAWVTRSGNGWTALSSGDGFYAFLRVTPGTYDLTASHPDHGSASAANVNVSAGEVVEVDLILGAVPAGISVLGAD
jgi:hypothetical protein